MHGVIHTELQRFVVAKLGEAAWQRLVREAGLEGEAYLASQAYPDEQIVALVQTASRLSGQSVPYILEAFGTFIAPELAQMYRAYIDPSWRTLDFLLNTEDTIHRVVRRKNPGAAPPELHVTRLSPNQVRIAYTSARKLCPVARGIVKGVAAVYGEQVEVSEPMCMHNGDPQCQIDVTLIEQS